MKCREPPIPTSEGKVDTIIIKFLSFFWFCIMLDLEGTLNCTPIVWDCVRKQFFPLPLIFSFLFYFSLYLSLPLFLFQLSSPYTLTVSPIYESVSHSYSFILHIPFQQFLVFCSLLSLVWRERQVVILRTILISVVRASFFQTREEWLRLPFPSMRN